jgi:excisionase family DNA binding protein
MPPIIEDKAGTESGGLATVDQAAAFLQLSRTSVYGLMSAGTLPFIRIEGLNCRRIRWEVLRAIAAGQQVNPYRVD